MVFRLNLPFASAIVVQSETMRAAVEETYPDSRGRIHVVAQPVPVWLQKLRSSRKRPIIGADLRMRLFYPAAPYPHKNHRLLAAVSGNDAATWPVEALMLTIPEEINPNVKIPWLRCCGMLTPADMVQAYADSDALVFLSLTESYGFPLVEAMWLGLPVVCPDLPYARNLCGTEAIYFNPRDAGSLRAAILELSHRLRAGWSPQWDAQVATLPVNWRVVAESLLAIAAG
jgi:glycosyltransferase involved in cell wall biosynthesis